MLSCAALLITHGVAFRILLRHERCGGAVLNLEPKNVRNQDCQTSLTTILEFWRPEIGTAAQELRHLPYCAPQKNSFKMG
jgi:hypothetical protein